MDFSTKILPSYKTFLLRNDSTEMFSAGGGSSKELKCKKGDSR